MPRKRKVGRKPSGIKKSSLNTTIRTDVLNLFRNKCNDIGMPMSLIIEMFMIGFIKGKFRLGIVDGDFDMELKE